MINTFKKIFDFSGGNRNTLKKSVVFSVIHSIFDFLQLLALAIVLNGLISGITEKKHVDIFRHYAYKYYWKNYF